jgi:glycosyltransferase involved in cell wall biosynthesis
MNISIVICCYNSAERIVPTLEHLANQEINGILCELILVNNNSTDEILSVAQLTWESLNAPFKIEFIHESVAGKTHALKSGVLASKGDIILICDDDNWLEKDYFRKTLDYFAADDNIGVIGGFSEAVSNTEFPDWFTSFQGAYAVGCQSIEDGDITKRGYVWGAGSAFRRKTLILFYSLGITHYCAGPKATNKSSGDDTEMCLWIKYAGYKLCYFSDLRFKHFIPKNRLTIEYCKSLYVGFSESQSILDLYEKIHKGSKNLYLRKQMQLSIIFFVSLAFGHMSRLDFYQNIFLITRGRLYKKKLDLNFLEIYSQVQSLLMLRNPL